MRKAYLEHVNVTVADPLQVATQLTALFDWEIRWQGEAIDQGFTVHVGEVGGDAASYLALYRGRENRTSTDSTYQTVNGLNHIGLVVQDLDAAEARVKSEGHATYSHADYEPGRRFYFTLQDDLEVEVISYS